MIKRFITRLRLPRMQMECCCHRSLTCPLSINQSASQPNPIQYVATGVARVDDIALNQSTCAPANISPHGCVHFDVQYHMWIRIPTNLMLLSAETEQSTTPWPAIAAITEPPMESNPEQTRLGSGCRAKTYLGAILGRSINVDKEKVFLRVDSVDYPADAQIIESRV
jgi:hypothetical protein